MSNQLLQYNLVARESLYVLANKLGYSKHCNMEYKSEFTNKRHGYQITVPRPPRYTARRGAAMAIQGITEPDVVVTIQPEVGVDLELTHSDMKLITGDRLPEFRKKIIDPAMSQLASTIDSDLADEARKQVYNYVGTAGTAPTTLADILAPNIRLNQEGVPPEGRTGVFGPGSHGSLVNGLAGNFVTKVIDSAELRADLNFPIAGMDRLVMSQSTPAHTVGVFAGTGLVNGAGQNGNSLVMNNWTAGDILNEGDVIRIAGVNAINYQTRKSTGVLRQFVVRANATADAAGVMTVSIYPPISPPVAGVDQQFQTVDSFPANGAAVTISTGTTGAVNQENLVFQKDAIGLISLPQVIPPDAFYAEMLMWEGIAVRFWMGSDITNNRALMRVDWLGAVPVYYPEAACRVAG